MNENAERGIIEHKPALQKNGKESDDTTRMGENKIICWML